MEEGKIVWPDWTVGGAERFLEWLYTEDYKCPYPVEASKKDKIREGKDDGVSGGGSTSKGIRRKTYTVLYGSYPVSPKKKRSDLVAETDTQCTAVPSTHIKDVTWSGSRPLKRNLSEAEEFDQWTGHQLWSSAQLDYQATFMTHAELYNMACTYQLDELKNMAWQRLKSVLVTVGQLVPGSAVVGNLVSLIRYAYEVTGDIGEEEEPLRKLVATFAASNISYFEGPDVDELMRSAAESDREFVVDLMAKIRTTMKRDTRLDQTTRKEPAKAAKRKKSTTSTLEPNNSMDFCEECGEAAVMAEVLCMSCGCIN